MLWQEKNIKALPCVKSFLGPFEINQDVYIDKNFIYVRSIMRADDQALNVTEYGKSF